MNFLYQAESLKAKLIRFFFALASGAFLALSFAPFNYFLLPFVCIGVLSLLCFSANKAQSFYYGLAFGFGMFLVGTSWVYVSMNVYGGMPPWMGIIAVMLFSLVMGLFSAFSCQLAAYLSPKNSVWRLVSFAACWVIFEWSKSWVFTGFPWLDIGYTQTSTWLFDLAPIGGVYLVSFAVLVISLALLACIVLPKKLFSAGLAISVVACSWLASSVEWSQPIGNPIQIGVVQGNTPINDKWRPQYRNKVIENLSGMSHQLNQTAIQSGQKLDLVVWAETALPAYYQQTNDQFWENLTPNNSALLTGLVDAPNAEHEYNAALLNCDGEKQLYRKRHLVPFGEYLPLRSLFGWVLDYLQLPMSDFSAWQGMQSLQCGENLKIGLSICYEDAFAGESRRYSGDATVLVNISEDAWFGDSFAPHQRLQIGQMRAKELSRSMIRSANSGPSAIIDHRGHVVIKTLQFEPAILLHEVQPRQGKTLYKQFGNWIVWFSFVVLALVFFLNRAKR